MMMALCSTHRRLRAMMDGLRLTRPADDHQRGRDARRAHEAADVVDRVVPHRRDDGDRRRRTPAAGRRGSAARRGCSGGGAAGRGRRPRRWSRSGRRWPGCRASSCWLISSGASSASDVDRRGDHPGPQPPGPRRGAGPAYGRTAVVSRPARGSMLFGQARRVRRGCRRLRGPGERRGGAGTPGRAARRRWQVTPASPSTPHRRLGIGGLPPRHRPDWSATSA